MRRSIFAMLSVCFVVGCQSQPKDQVLSAADSAALRALTERYASTALAADWDGWAGQLTDDATFLPPNGPAISGRSALRQWITNFARITSFTATTIELGGAGDVAWVRGSYAFAMGPSAQMQVADSGNFLSINHRQSDGSWRIHRNIWNSTAPLPAPPATRPGR